MTEPTRQEAERLLARYGEDNFIGALKHVEQHFGVIQSRNQFLLTIGTLTLTITGFSGPKIAESGIVSRLGLVGGLAMVLAAMVALLLGSLRIHWLTEFNGTDDADTLTQAIAYRNRKTNWFQFQLLLLVAGLACYVLAVVAYLFSKG